MVNCTFPVTKDTITLYCQIAFCHLITCLVGPACLVFHSFVYLVWDLPSLFPQEFSPFSTLLDIPYYCWISLFCSLIIQWDWMIHWEIFDEKQALQLWSPHISWSLPIGTSNLLSTPWIQSFWLLVMHICSKISFYCHLFYIDLYLFGYILQYKLGVEP